MKKIKQIAASVALLMLVVMQIVPAKASSGEKEKINKKELQDEESFIKIILESIPSPVEITTIIKEGGNLYNKADLNPTSNSSKYSSSYKKAINLGIYGTDLGLANMYGKNQDAITYLNSVKSLADGLSIGQFFDYETLKGLLESANNIDQLIAQTTSNLEKINHHLQKQSRDNLSVLILTGNWIEGLYLTTKVYERKKNDVLREKIGEQKIVLEQLLSALEFYKTKPYFPELINDLNELYDIYDAISIETTFGAATQKIVDGQLIVEDSSESTVNITDADVQTITSLVRSIRNKMIN